jgi:hypothetical protein
MVRDKQIAGFIIETFIVSGARLVFRILTGKTKVNREALKGDSGTTGSVVSSSLFAKLGSKACWTLLKHGIAVCKLGYPSNVLVSIVENVVAGVGEPLVP